jgi:hypothetical protein
MAIVAVLCLGAGAAIQAQTPQPQPQPKLQAKPSLTLKWLRSLTPDPATVTPGQDSTGTVTLLRPAIQEMKFSVFLNGAQPIEGGVQLLNNVLMPTSVTWEDDIGTATQIALEVAGATIIWLD